MPKRIGSFRRKFFPRILRDMERIIPVERDEKITFIFYQKVGYFFLQK